MPFILTILFFIIFYYIIKLVYRIFFKNRSFPNEEDTTVYNPDSSHEKIFKKNEGEYVDYEEVKEDKNTENADQN